MKKFDINYYTKAGREIGGQNALQLKRDGYIDSSFNFLQADDIQGLVENLENFKSHFIYNGETTHYATKGERLDFEFINVVLRGTSVWYTMAYRAN